MTTKRTKYSMDKHGVSVEFIDGKLCKACKKHINNRPALYVFLYRGTSAGQGAYWHISCAKKLKPQMGSGVDRQTGRQFQSKLHFSFQINRYAQVKINVPYIKKLLQSSKHELLKQCTKSRNISYRNNVIRHLTTQQATRFGCLKLKQRLSKLDQSLLTKQLQDKQNPIVVKDICAKIKSMKPYIAGYYQGLGYRFCVRRKQVRVCIYVGEVQVYAPSMNWHQECLLQKQLMKNTYIRRLRKVAHNLNKHKKYLELLSELNDNLGVTNFIDLPEFKPQDIKKHIIRLAANKIAGRDNQNLSVENLAPLLFDGEPIVRRLAQQELRRLNKGSVSKNSSV